MDLTYDLTQYPLRILFTYMKLARLNAANADAYDTVSMTIATLPEPYPG